MLYYTEKMMDFMDELGDLLDRYGFTLVDFKNATVAVGLKIRTKMTDDLVEKGLLEEVNRDYEKGWSK